MLYKEVQASTRQSHPSCGKIIETKKRPMIGDKALLVPITPIIEHTKHNCPMKL